MRLALVALLGLAAPCAAAERPNFVFVFADDQRYDAMSVVQKEQGDKGRFPWFQTPNMDRLAAEGIRFRNAFVVNSLCSPSRACYLSGRYNHHNGIVNNSTALDAGVATHASILRAEGYATGYVGKWHMGGQPERPGFDWYASFTGQGTYFNANFLVNGKPERAPDWTDDRSAAYAIRFLETDRPKDRPFVLVVGFKAPHGPFQPPSRRETSFADAKARPTPNIGLRPGFNADLGPEGPRPAQDGVVVNLNYFRAIAGVDDNLGKILDALDRLDLARNTVVVYASDNGFYLREHGLADKRSGYDESLRIPLIVRDPRSALRGVVRDELVLNIDLAPTFLDLAGVAVPATMQGKSWKPLLTDGAARPTFRASFFYEYFRENSGNDTSRSVGGYNTPTMTAVRTATHKLLKYRGRPEWTELFDLQADPYETQNLFPDRAHAAVRAKLEAEHEALANQVGYRVPDHVPAEPNR